MGVVSFQRRVKRDDHEATDGNDAKWKREAVAA
jgi:hypothetical protein